MNWWVETRRHCLPSYQIPTLKNVCRSLPSSNSAVWYSTIHNYITATFSISSSYHVSLYTPGFIFLNFYLAHAVYLKCKYSLLLRHTPKITAYWSWRRPEKFKPKDFLFRKQSKILRNAGYNKTNYLHSNLSIKSRKYPGAKKLRCECQNNKQMLTFWQPLSLGQPTLANRIDKINVFK